MLFVWHAPGLLPPEFTKVFFFACFSLVARGAECLEVFVCVVVGSSCVVDVVDFGSGVSACLAGVVVSFEYAVSGGGGDVLSVVPCH